MLAGPETSLSKEKAGEGLAEEWEEEETQGRKGKKTVRHVLCVWCRAAPTADGK